MLHQEKRFELPLEHEIVVTGRMDQMNRIADGGIEIVDYKTGRPRDEKKAAEDLQLSVYALAAQEVLDITPSRLVFYNLTTNEAIATIARRENTRRNEAEDRLTLPIRFARRIFCRARLLRAGYCDYKPLCPAHEQLINIQVDQAFVCAVVALSSKISSKKKRGDRSPAAPFLFRRLLNLRSLDRFRA